LNTERGKKGEEEGGRVGREKLRERASPAFPFIPVSIGLLLSSSAGREEGEKGRKGRGVGSEEKPQSSTGKL